MDIKQELRDVRRIDMLMRRKSEELETMRCRVVYSVPLPDPNGGSFGSHNPHSKEEMIIRIMELEEYVGKLGQEYEKVYQQAIKYIMLFDDERMKELFSKRYLDYRPWEDIAKALDITKRGAYKMHGRGLKEICEKTASEGLQFT